MNKFVKSLVTLSITAALGATSAHSATYQVIDKGAAEKFKYTYSQQENNFGEMALSGTQVYNFPVQFEYLDEDDYDAIIASAKAQNALIDDLSDIENEDSLRAGDPTANDLSWVKRYLQGKSSSFFYQKVGDVIAMKNFGGETTEFRVFDQVFENTVRLTYSTVDYVNGITNDGWLYGNASAPYLPFDFTESDDDEVTHWIREFSTRGYFSPDGGATIVPLIAPESSYGGESAIIDISDSNIAVGYASVSIDQNALDFIDDDTGGCADPDVLDDIPFELCVQQISSNMYNTEAFKWQLDENGITSSEGLGQLVTPNEDDQRELTSYAQAVNSSGVVVGFATGWVDEDETDPSVNEQSSLYAVVFKNGEVKDFTENHSEYFDSRAYDINNQGFAVGHAKKFINGSARNKFYYVDTNESTPLMVLPDDFFDGSASSAYAINENNMVVGAAEVETHNDTSQNPRRTHGYLYDINTDTFSDLNDFLPCNSPYSIIEARDINDNNEISATAILKVERRDSKGQLMLDEDGNPLVEDVVRAVKLSPISGEVDDCSKVEEKIERKGAGFGLLSLYALLGVCLFRRFRMMK